MKTVSSSLLSPFSNLTALFTTRHGGVSHSPYHTANLAFHVGDHPSDVIRNHDLLAASVGYERTKLVHMRQIHSDTIVVVDSSHHFEAPPGCDALRRRLYTQTNPHNNKSATTMAYTPELIAELEILALYNLDNHQEGLKVHNNASNRAQMAITRLHEKGLVTQADGGYLTSLGLDAAEHAQALLTILRTEPARA